MVESLINISDIDLTSVVESSIQSLPPELAASLGTLLTIFKAVGIVIIVYLIFLIISIIFNLKRYRLIKKTWGKVQEIDEKLDKLTSKKHEIKEKPKEEKKKK